MPDPVAALVDQLADVGRSAVERGLVVASGGNLSARLPGRDAYLVTASGTWLDRLRVEDFTVMGLDGTVLDGNHRPSTEWRLHSRTYEVRPDANAIVHLHPQTAVVLDALGHPIRMLTLDDMTYLREIRRIPFLPNGSDELADAAAAASIGCDVVIMANHGCSTIGETIEMAHRRALVLDLAAQNTALCLQLGDRDTSFPAGATLRVHG
jgi:L-fuculose-phosphate aldolase